MSDRLKAGVIGLGILGSQHADFLRRHSSVELVAVTDIRKETADAEAVKLGVKSYGDYRQMLKSHALDLAVVATPDAAHREPTLACLEAGVPNIIQEKPLATTRDDARAIYEAVEKRKARLFVNFANRTAPLDVATRYVIQEGLVGSVVYGEARLDDNICVPTRMWGDRTKAWAAGSSPAHFLLSHVVDLLRWYFSPSEVTEVYAISRSEVLGYTPDLYDAFLTFTGGLTVRIKAEWIKHIDQLVEFYLCFSATEGTVIYNKLAGFGASAGWRANLRASLAPHDLARHQEALLSRGVNVAARLHRPVLMGEQPKAGETALSPALEFDGPNYGEWFALVDCCIDAIIGDTLEPSRWKGGGPLPTHIDGLKQTLVTTAIIESAETGKTVRIG